MKLLSLLKELSLHPKNAKELKGLILQLAVQGKLTFNWREKNPAKQTSEDLLEIINKGKIDVLLDSGVKKEKPIDEFDIAQVKFELPKSWLWVRFASSAYICRGGSPRPIKNYITDDPNGINWIKIGDTKGVLKYIEKCREKIIPEGLKKSRLVKSGDFILSNSMSFGKPYIMKTTGCIHDGWLLIREVKDAINKDYLYHMLSSPYIYSSFKDSAAGGVVQNLNIQKVRQTLIPVPPLEEQKAIVEVVNTLLKEVEALENLTKERISLKEDFVTSALRMLTETDNTTQEWNYLQQHFSSFFTEKKNIKSLRETILQLAVQGKLTAQWREENPSLENASELLKRIKTEKLQLITEKKIKKEKSLPSLNDVPFELPNSWSWCYLNSLGVIGSSSRVHQKDWQTKGVPFYRAREIVKLAKFGSVNNNLFISEELFDQHKKNGSVPLENDIMITGVGTIGIPYVVTSEDLFYFKDASVLIFKNIFNLNHDYLKLFFNTPYWKKEIHRESMGTTVHTLTISRAKAVLTIFPPTEEQQAIVEKVNSFMVLCDELEQQTDNSQSQIEQLMQSCLKEVFEEESN